MHSAKSHSGPDERNMCNEIQVYVIDRHVCVRKKESCGCERERERERGKRDKEKTFVYLCVCVCTCVCMPVYVYVFVCVLHTCYIHSQTQTYLYVYMCVYIYIFKHMDSCIYTHISVCDLFKFSRFLPKNLTQLG